MKAMRMNCLEAQAELPLFVGGDLESAIQERVAAHLETCLPCRDALLAASESRDVLVMGLQQTADLHGAFVATSDTPSVWPGLRDQLRAEGMIRTSAGGPVSAGSTSAASAVGGGLAAPAPRGRLLHWVSTSAAAAVLLIFGAVAGQHWLGSDQSTIPSGPGSQNNPTAAVPNGSSVIPTPVHSGAGSLAGLTPVNSTPGGLSSHGNGQLRAVSDPAPGLRKVECLEDSYTRDPIWLTGRELQPFIALPASGMRTVSLQNSSLPAPLPAPTPSMDGVR